ncbi:MAG: hypothetical protein CMI95_04405 [Pelagibacteraceae bacterium]|nr:hypothetical protein [Pelagibacteraceae bacterium]|tara:strand:- start:2307 stop:2720 length:414 start_codon:yes stop_codon:yes gene_type:complete
MFTILFNFIKNNAIYLLSFYLLLTTFFLRDPLINIFNISTCILIISKWLTNYNICTMGIIECKLRRVSRGDSYIYQILDNIVNINKNKEKYFFYILYMIIIIINFRKFRKSNFNLFKIDHYKKYIENGFNIKMKINK